MIYLLWFPAEADRAETASVLTAIFTARCLSRHVHQFSSTGWWPSCVWIACDSCI
jgi:hypothetical protein